jgi:protein SCO1/2
VLTSDGRVSRYLYGVEFAPRDLRLALVEAGGGRVGTTLDRVLLTCYRYDPATHRYALLLGGLLRGGSLVILLAVGLFLLRLWRREQA